MSVRSLGNPDPRDGRPLCFQFLRPHNSRTVRLCVVCPCVRAAFEFPESAGPCALTRGPVILHRAYFVADRPPGVTETAGHPSVILFCRRACPHCADDAGAARSAPGGAGLSADVASRLLPWVSAGPAAARQARGKAAGRGAAPRRWGTLLLEARPLFTSAGDALPSSCGLGTLPCELSTEYTPGWEGAGLPFADLGQSADGRGGACVGSSSDGRAVGLEKATPVGEERHMPASVLGKDLRRWAAMPGRRAALLGFGRGRGVPFRQSWPQAPQEGTVATESGRKPAGDGLDLAFGSEWKLDGPGGWRPGKSFEKFQGRAMVPHVGGTPTPTDLRLSSLLSAPPWQALPPGGPSTADSEPCSQVGGGGGGGRGQSGTGKRASSRKGSGHLRVWAGSEENDRVLAGTLFCASRRPKGTSTPDSGG